MPRFPRYYIKTLYFHVITQGINKNFIFDNEEDIKYYIKIMYKLLKEQNVKVIAYCVMNNHAHILLEADQIKELSKYMQRLNTAYGIYYNKKYNKIGYVFRNRYKSEGIFSEEHLYNCINYIYNNPVKAKICNKPEEYQYSNYKKINESSNRNYIFLEIEEDREREWKNFIKKFVKENNVELLNYKKNDLKVKELIKILKEKYNLSLRRISKELCIGREIIRKIYNK